MRLCDRPRFPPCGSGATRRIRVVGKILYSIHLLCESGRPDDTHGGYSSVGRAADCGSAGRAFEPRYPPQQGPASAGPLSYALKSGNPGHNPPPSGAVLSCGCDNTPLSRLLGVRVVVGVRRHALGGAVRCAGILDICVCRRHALCDRRGRAGHPRVRGNARSNAAAGGQGAIGPVDWAVFPIQGKCGRSVAAPQMKNNQRIGEFSCLRLNSSSVRDVRPSRRSRRLWP